MEILNASENDAGGASESIFSRCVSGTENRLALAAAKAISDEPGGTYNPLFIHSATGLGKTFLLRAIAESWTRKMPALNVRYLTAEEFVEQHYQAVRESRLDDFRQQFSQLDALLLDEAHRLTGNSAAQGTLISIFNALYDNKRQIVIASLVPPAHIGAMREGLVSRMQWGLVVELESPGKQLREAILQVRAAEMKLDLSAEMLAHLSEVLGGNIRELEGILLRLHSHASLLDQTPDLALTREVTRDYTRKPPRRITLDQIRAFLCSRFSISNEDLLSRTRARSISYPRQIGMYLAHEKTPLSLEDIGKQFGGRDHSTVKHGCEKIRKLCEADPEMRELMRDFEREALAAV